MVDEGDRKEGGREGGQQHFIPLLSSLFLYKKLLYLHNVAKL